MKANICIYGIVLLTALRIHGQGAGENNDPTQKSIGDPPYEMKGRKEVREPFITFDDCAKWHVIAKQGEARLYRTQEQRVITDYSGKVAYKTDSNAVSFRVELVNPLKLKRDWDCINFWNIGSKWWWKPGPTMTHSLIIKDARGKEQIIRFVQEWLWPDMCYKYWYLDHIKLSDTIAKPVTLVGMEFTGNGDPQDVHHIFLGPVYAYKEELNPISFKPLPEKLPFPLRKQTILPTNKIKDYINSVIKSGDVYLLKYDAKDASITYIVNPIKPIGGISVLHNGEEKSICTDAEIVFEEKATVKWSVIKKNLIRDTLFIQYKAKGKRFRTTFDCYYTINQKSLIWCIEEISKTGHVEEIRLGKTGKISDGKLVTVPFLHYNPRIVSDNSYTLDAPNLLYADGLFYLTMFDWYYTDASMFFGGNKEIKDGFATYNGGVRYIPLINKVRNPVRERLFINVSPDVHEVFPTIDNPKSPIRSIQADRLWAINGGSDLESLGKLFEVTNMPEANKYLKREYREGWSL